jgi:hypothetical protein
MLSRPWPWPWPESFRSSALADALELTFLIARKDPRRHSRAAARWLQRYLEEHPEATIEEAALVSSALFQAEATRRRSRLFAPWPKRPLADGELTA